ncbi:MAG: CHAP domain-containing protein [Desulfobacterales bacterium]|nr:CHAP domain-containing protein [Desulfobacterales bacterium]
MSKHPNGLWIWYLSKIQGDYLNRLIKCRVKRIYLKVFDGKSNPMFWDFQCTPEIIQQFKNAGIQVYGWGFHYGTSDVNDQLASVKNAMNCGLDGYIADMEATVENEDTHPDVEKLLFGLRSLIPIQNGIFGYTSFGHPGFHKQVPWRLLNKYCDIALPQIYFELFRFGSSNEDEVQACLNAHKQMGLDKPVLPIWSSENNAATPASAGELQMYLNRYPGSSIWRAPHVYENRGEAWNLTYDGTIIIPENGSNLNELPTLNRLLRKGCIGEDVKILQKVLNELGFNAGEVDGIFGSRTEKAVKSFQTQADITVDGIVGPETWGELRGQSNIEQPEQGVLAHLADLAQQECYKGLSWTGPDCEAEKYLSPLRKPMQELGHIGSSPVFFNWCAAFVSWCCKKANVQVPDIPEGYWATMALVESWKYWAKKKGYWHPKGSITPKRGDILVFEWFDGDVQLDHIGIVKGYTPGSSLIQTSEGNKGNKTQNATRSLSNVPGFIRIAG